MNILPPPGPQRTRQLAMLAVLVVALVVVGWKFYGSAESSKTTTAPPPTSNTQTRASSPQPAEAARTLPQPVRLERLEPVPELPESSRNPFRYYVPPPPPPPPRPPVVAPPPQPPPPPPGPPPPPPIALDFIGRIVRNDGKVMATLRDGKGAIFTAMDGDIVDGRYRVVSIGQESVIVEYVDGKGRTTRPLR